MSSSLHSPAGMIAAPLALAGLVGLAWFGLSMATGLLFHLMPGATFLAVAWGFRGLSGRPATRTEVTTLLGGAGAVTAVGLVAIPTAGGVVGVPVETVIVVLVGVSLAGRWLLRSTGPRPRHQA